MNQLFQLRFDFQTSERNDWTDPAPEETQAGLDKIAKGDLPDSTNITKVIVDGYQDGAMIVYALYLGPAADGI